jgi:hypothetical protein
LNHKQGLLDKYFFITGTTKDSIILIADIYNNGKLLIPMGLKLQN